MTTPTHNVTAETILERAEKKARKEHYFVEEPAKGESIWSQFSENYRSELCLEVIREMLKEPSAAHALMADTTKLRIHGTEMGVHAIVQGLANHAHLEAIGFLKELLDEHSITFIDDLKAIDNYEELPYVQPFDESEINHIIDGEEYEVLEATALEVNYTASFSSSELHNNGLGIETFNVLGHIDKIIILLSTGGPASRAVLDLDQEEAWIEVSDWWLGWNKLIMLSDETYTLLKEWALPDISAYA